MRIAVSYLFQPIFIELDPILYDRVRFQFHNRVRIVEIVVVPDKVITLLQPQCLAGETLMAGKRIFGYGHTVLLFFVPHDSKSGMLLFVSSHIEKRTWSHLLSLVPQCIGFRIALFVETSNADQPHERFIYNDAR